MLVVRPSLSVHNTSGNKPGRIIMGALDQRLPALQSS